MNFVLQFPNHSEIKVAQREYDEELDDVRSVLSDLCEAIEDEAEFIVEGFGQSSWPVDVFTDLPVFLEQLPALIHAIEMSASACIDFYEQGIERRIDLTFGGKQYACRCSSQSDWQPEPEVEYLDKEILLEMLVRFEKQFLRIVSIVAPELSANPWLKSWSQ